MPSTWPPTRQHPAFLPGGAATGAEATEHPNVTHRAGLMPMSIRAPRLSSAAPRQGLFVFMCSIPPGASRPLYLDQVTPGSSREADPLSGRRRPLLSDIAASAPGGNWGAAPVAPLYRFSLSGTRRHRATDRPTRKPSWLEGGWSGEESIGTRPGCIFYISGAVKAV